MDNLGDVLKAVYGFGSIQNLAEQINPDRAVEIVGLYKQGAGTQAIKAAVEAALEEGKASVDTSDSAAGAGEGE